MKEYLLASSEVSYEDSGEQAPMGFTASGRGFCDGNSSHWWNKDHPLFPNQTFSENTNWETAAVCMSSVQRGHGKGNM